MKLCPKCGAENRNVAKFCSACREPFLIKPDTLSIRKSSFVIAVIVILLIVIGYLLISRQGIEKPAVAVPQVQSTIAIVVPTQPVVAKSPSSKLKKPTKTNYEKGVDALKDKNYSDAMKFFQAAHEEGNAKAEEKIGYLYANGFGATKNYLEAIKWNDLSIKHGNANAQDNVNTLRSYYSDACFGKGSAAYNNKNYAEARDWWYEAEKYGNDKQKKDAKQFSSLMNGILINWGTPTHLL